MFKAIKRWWKYMGAKLNSNVREKADPKIQLEQTIQEAQTQHRRLKEQAANVIANQKQAELRLNRSMEELEKVNINTRQALMMADRSSKSGDEQKATEYSTAAESFASRLVNLEREVEENKTMVLQTTQAAEQAKSAVTQNSNLLQQKLSERQKLLSQLDQAKMQEDMNKAMAALTETVGDDVPTFDEVREKIEARYAKAKGAGELTEASVEGRMLEIEQASMNVAAISRLDEIRGELGLPTSTGELTAGGSAGNDTTGNDTTGNDATDAGAGQGSASTSSNAGNPEDPGDPGDPPVS